MVINKVNVSICTRFPYVSVYTASFPVAVVFESRFGVLNRKTLRQRKYCLHVAVEPNEITYYFAKCYGKNDAYFKVIS